MLMTRLFLRYRYLSGAEHERQLRQRHPEVPGRYEGGKERTLSVLVLYPHFARPLSSPLI